MSDYAPLTEKLTELTEKAKAGVPHCTTYAHEMAAVVLAAVELSALCTPNPHAAKIKPEIVEKATMDRTIPYPVAIALKDALDALQAVMT